MKHKTSIFLFTILLLAGLFISIPYEAGSVTYPRPQGAINDFAGVIPAKQKRAMDALAQEVLKKTGTAVVVATLKTIEDNDPADYANRLYEAWGIGKKGEDKGVLILLALRERKIRIETGYGVEGILPDGLVGEILDRYVVPYLKKGEYGNGLANGMIALSLIIAKDAGVSLSGGSAPYRARQPRNKEGFNPFSFVVLLIILALLFGTRGGRRLLPIILLALMMGGGRGGGGFGGFSGGFGGFGGGLSGGGGAGRGF